MTDEGNKVAKIAIKIITALVILGGIWVLWQLVVAHHGFFTN